MCSLDNNTCIVTFITRDLLMGIASWWVFFSTAHLSLNGTISVMEKSNKTVCPQNIPTISPLSVIDHDLKACERPGQTFYRNTQKQITQTVCRSRTLWKLRKETQNPPCQKQQNTHVDGFAEERACSHFCVCHLSTALLCRFYVATI